MKKEGEVFYSNILSCDTNIVLENESVEDNSVQNGPFTFGFEFLK